MSESDDRVAAAIIKFENGASIAHDMANGPEGATVNTESGPLPTLAEWQRIHADALGDAAAIGTALEEYKAGIAAGTVPLGYLNETVQAALTRAGKANQYAYGNIKQNEQDYATFAPSIVPPAAEFTRVNFAANGSHSAGTVGTLTAAAAGAAFSYYLLRMTISTNVSGRVKVKIGNVDAFGDMPDGIYFSSGTVLTQGIEQNREQDYVSYDFGVLTSSNSFTTLNFETDTAWQGSITAISLLPVVSTKFAVGGAGTGRGVDNPVGLKVGAYERNDIALGDKTTLAVIQDDGGPRQPAHRVAVGAKSQLANINGDEVTSVGNYCLMHNMGSNNTGGGYGCLKYNSKGQEIAAWGYKTFVLNRIGSRKTGMGFWAGGLNPTGDYDCVFGWYAGRNATGGSENVYFGAQSGQDNIDGSQNTYLGTKSGYGTGNAANHSSLMTLGGHSAYGTGDRATAWGAGAKALGPQGVALGPLAEARDFSVSAGAQAGVGSTGTNSVFLGYAAGGLAVNAYSGVICLGANSTVTGAKQLQLGAADVTAYSFGAVQSRSDKRDKTDVRDTVLGLDFLEKLRPVDWRFDAREAYFEDVECTRMVDESYESNVVDANGTPLQLVRKVPEKYIERRATTPDGSKAGVRFHHGVIAQDLEALIKESGVDFGGFQDHTVNGGTDVLSVGYSEFIGPLIRGIQQLSSRLKASEAEIASLKKLIK